MKRRADLSKVIDRPYTFGKAGEISRTLTLRTATEEEKAQFIKQCPPPIELGTDAALSAAISIQNPRAEKPIEETLEPLPDSVEIQPVVTPGPVVYKPEAGMLVL
jgi:hypothetical protein